MTLLHQTRLPLSDISCILFDMDGTLLDSAPGVTASAAAALAAVGAPVPSMKKLRRFVGPPMIESFRKVPSWMTKPPNGPSNAIAKSMPITDASEASQAAAVARSPSGLLPLILNNRRRPEQI
ncbi:phosphoglycolate phosphatase-like HAD superfamily hydrolase [Arthrobacter pascens]|uniref:HAD hydrolase-like protein n=1 Tax=Arthrobacter pascens TaxID=1677 RepID=UPI00277E00FE|nr:HAD hydrolase-like protein [Arthrobacter pascens]MDQ0632760.1 phosphoglycolate phosphatase-like HAD superfamily hydrolase [Arthrobacter pascens]